MILSNYIGVTPSPAAMVKVSTKENKELYQCEECSFHYVEKEQAGKCETWCREHKSCHLEITAQAEENKPN